MELRDKKIAIVGMGVNNKHLAGYLSKQGIKFDVFEQWADPDELIPKIGGYDILFRTPGLPYLSKVIQEALNQGIEISSQTKLFFDLCPCPIIGVTGTKGKGTTSSLIHSILLDAGKKSWLAGNIGKDPFEFLEEIKKDDFVVLELSSFQLQDLHKSPHIAVVLNITLDHVNPNLKMSTHYTREEYLQAKAKIVAAQTEEDFAVLNPDLPDWFKEAGKGKKIIYDPKSVSHMKTMLLGKHNLENIAPAVEVAKILRIDQRTIDEAVAEFAPLPHRLEYFVGEDGITYVNDSFSTNEDSTIAAIAAFSQPTVLILGGSDKGHTYEGLAKAISESSHVKGAVVIGDVAERIKKTLHKFTGKVADGGKTMHEILRAARDMAQKGDVILLSPAAASFGLFKDYKERGSLFMKEAHLE
jgi:UDP-N-acetylmuramoylalanine--D-glutamate ligase